MFVDHNFHSFPYRFKARTTKDHYISQVEKLKTHIQQGDIYEVNYCQEFYAEDALINPLETYTKLNAISKEIDSYKKTYGLIDFTDMLDKFLEKGSISNKLDVVFVDEAQDCSKPQIKALQKAATNAIKFIFIGDPDQTIHEYAGSDPEFFYKLDNNLFPVLLST